MGIFENNLRILKSRYPKLADRVLSCNLQNAGIQIATARSGEKVPMISGRALHSTYEPLGEARKFVARQAFSDAKAVVVLGLAFGYHVDELLRSCEIPVVVVEARPEILRAAMECRDLEEILSRVYLICAEPPALLLTQEVVFAAVQAEACRTVVHDPSARVASSYYEAVKAELSCAKLPGRQGRLKVLVVSPLFGGSWSVSRCSASALTEIGCDTVFLDLSSFQPASHYLAESLKNTTVQAGMSELFHRFLCEFIYWKIKQLQPDLVLFLAQAPASVELLKKLRVENIRTAFWFVENYRLFPYWKEVAPQVDYFFTIQRGEFFAKLDASGAFNHFYLPLACDPNVHRSQLLDQSESDHYGSEISAAGFGYYNRLHVMQGMTDFQLKLWGPGWDRALELTPFIQAGGAEFTQEMMLKIYSASTVNVNLHSSTYSTGVEPGGDFVNPRTFELAACRAFQLTDERAELSHLFEIGSEIVTFKDVVSLRKQARYYLDHPEERREVTRRAQQRALREHTYAIRMRQMLEYIFPVSWIDRRTSKYEEPGLAFRLLKEISPEHDLYSLLKDSPADTRVTLQDLIAKSTRNYERPTPEEVTLRWMDNILREGQRR